MCEKNKNMGMVNKQEIKESVEELTANMEQIYKSTKQCKEIVCTLDGAFQEIAQIMKTLTNMSVQTNQLAQKTVADIEETIRESQ